MTRIAMRVEIDLDMIPGWGYDAADHVKNVQQVLPAWYNPTVTLMPQAHEFAVSYASLKVQPTIDINNTDTCRICGGPYHTPVTDGVLPDNPWGATETGTDYR